MAGAPGNLSCFGNFQKTKEVLAARMPFAPPPQMPLGRSAPGQKAQHGCSVGNLANREAGGSLEGRKRGAGLRPELAIGAVVQKTHRHQPFLYAHQGLGRDLGRCLARVDPPDDYAV